LRNVIRRAHKDPHVKAIVLRNDSPGGSVIGLDNIRRAVEVSNAPIVASMGNVCKRLYIAASCNMTFANAMTITGSIGVMMHTFNTTELFETLGITVDSERDVGCGGRARSRATRILLTRMRKFSPLLLLLQRSLETGSVSIFLVVWSSQQTVFLWRFSVVSIGCIECFRSRFGSLFRVLTKNSGERGSREIGINYRRAKRTASGNSS